MADAKGKPKWGKGGELVSGAKGRARKLKLSLVKVAKEDGAKIGIGALVGAAATGAGAAIASQVPMLRDAVNEGGMKKAIAIAVPSLAIAGGGLMLASRFVTTPKKAAELAPFVLGATVIFSVGPTLVAEVSDRVDSFVRGLFGPSTAAPATPGGGNAGMGYGGVRTGGTLPRNVRRARLPDEITPGGGNAGEGHGGVRTGGTIPRTNRW